MGRFVTVLYVFFISSLMDQLRDINGEFNTKQSNDFNCRYYAFAYVPFISFVRLYYLVFKFTFFQLGTLRSEGQPKEGLTWLVKKSQHDLQGLVLLQVKNYYAYYLHTSAYPKYQRNMTNPVRSSIGIGLQSTTCQHRKIRKV